MRYKYQATNNYRRHKDSIRNSQNVLGHADTVTHIRTYSLKIGLRNTKVWRCLWSVRIGGAVDKAEKAKAIVMTIITFIHRSVPKYSSRNWLWPKTLGGWEVCSALSQRQHEMLAAWLFSCRRKYPWNWIIKHILLHGTWLATDTDRIPLVHRPSSCRRYEPRLPDTVHTCSDDIHVEKCRDVTL